MRNAFESIQQGLKEAIEFAEGSTKTATIRHNVDVTQKELANTFGISLGTLRHWKKGDSKLHPDNVRAIKQKS